MCVFLIIWFLFIVTNFQILVYRRMKVLFIHIVLFYSYKFSNVGIHGNESSFFTWTFKVCPKSVQNTLLFPSPLHQILTDTSKTWQKNYTTQRTVSNGNTNQPMTANCQNLTSYGRKHQHLLDDFVNQDGINSTNNICQH